MKTKGKLLNISVICAALLIVTAVCISILFTGATGIAYAADKSFSVVFPTSDYFQSKNPTNIAVGGDYLLIYDKADSALFVRDNDSNTTR